MYIYRLIYDNIELRRTARFFEKPENIEKYNTKIKEAKNLLFGSFPKEALDSSLPEINSVSDFYELSTGDQKFVIRFIKSALHDE